jgi:hypothetical protein
MRKRPRIFLIVSVIIAAILAVKAILFFTAKPKIDVDYPAKINTLSKPLDYDPNKDGFKYLIKASDLYIKAPLLSGKTLWPNEMDETDLSVLKTWVAAGTYSPKLKN